MPYLTHLEAPEPWCISEILWILQMKYMLVT